MWSPINERAILPAIAVVKLAGDSISAANRVLTSLTAGAGRFTAAIAGKMARSFIGDHTIYPKIFQKHESTSSMDIKIKLRASGGDPYSFLTEMWTPISFILGMVLPKLSKNNVFKRK